MSDVTIKAPNSAINPLNIAEGGTNATTAAAARQNQEITPQNIEATPALLLQGNTMDAVYKKLDSIANAHTATFVATATPMNLLSNGAVITNCFGTVMRISGSTYGFIAHTYNNQYTYKWTITDFTSASNYTIGTVYRYVGTTV